VLLPTSGTVTIDGFDVTKNPHDIRKRIGFLPDTPPVYDEMTVGDYLAFVAQLRGISSSHAASRVREVEKTCFLEDRHGDPISSLSHGYRQRVGVAQALVHRPKLLILDEPTSGLDPVQIVEMRELIRRLKGEATVLVSSHILSEISQICDRYLVLHEGTVIADGSEAVLASTLGGADSVEIDIIGGPEKAVAATKAVESVTDVTVSPSGAAHCLRITASSDVRAAVVKALVTAGLDVVRVDRVQGRLENIFLKLTHGKETA
jgi:ABC-2 type transport system ATP-binding protein